MDDSPFPVCEVLNGGVQATVQDLGRSGYAAVGVPRAGAMDRFALTSANLALGNAANTAAVEILLGGLTLHFLASARIAIAGADLEVVLDDVALSNWHTYTVPAGARLHFGGRINGARAYLAIAGGLAVGPVLGSRSTYLGGGWGGFEGRPLRAGDVLDGLPTSHAAHALPQPPEYRPPYSRFPTLRCVVGPHHDAFEPSAYHTFFDGVYRLSPACDRMGYRLDGPQVATTKQALASAGVIAGCVQIPPNGQPIILMAEAQTTGGYPVIATVIGPDLPLAAQLLPGDKLRFQPVTVEAAIKIARAHYDALYQHRQEDIVGIPI
jgi:antagonist of KipI